MESSERASISTIILNGKHNLVDVASFEMLPGDKALIIRHDGSLAIAHVENFRKEGEAVRAALEPLDEACTQFAKCMIVGRVLAAAVVH